MLETIKHISEAESADGDGLAVRERRLEAAQKRVAELIDTIEAEIGEGQESLERLGVLQSALVGRLRAMGADRPEGNLSPGDNSEANMISLLLAYYDGRIAGMEKTLENEHIRKQIKEYFPIIDRSMIAATRSGA